MIVYFKDINPSSSILQLVILEVEHDPIGSSTSLVVHASLCGRYAEQWPKLANPLYVEQWSHKVSFIKMTKAWVLQTTHHWHFNELDNGQSLFPTLVVVLLKTKQDGETPFILPANVNLSKGIGSGPKTF